MFVTQTEPSPVAIERGSVPSRTRPSTRVGVGIDPNDFVCARVCDPDPVVVDGDV